MSKELAKALTEALFSPNEMDRNLECANVVDAMFAIARALDRIADQLKWLGNGDATTSMGAIEALGMHLGKSFDGIADAIERKGE